MAKLEDILKAQGWSDADIAANAAMLGDPKVRAALEGSYAALESERDAFKTENQKWADWHEKEGKPLVDLYEKERTEARAEAASLRERLKMAEESGFAPKREEPTQNPNPANPNPAIDPAKYLTHDAFKTEVGKFAQMEGDAIAIAANLAEEYRYLNPGKSLIEYEAEIDGRRLTGMVALRAEALQKKMRLDEYVSQKFDFKGSRQKIADEQRKKAEEAIRADERAKLATQYGDPSQRPLVASRDPFIPRPTNSEGKPVQPWEVPAQQRQSARIQRAMETEMKARLQ